MRVRLPDDVEKKMSDVRSVISHVRPQVRALDPYRVREVGGGYILMNKNENPYDLPTALKKTVLDAAMENSWSRYPPIVAQELHSQIANYAGWVPEGVVAANGSDETIMITLTTFLEPGKRVVIPNPTFPMFGYMATLIGATVENVPLNKDYSYNSEALFERFLDGGDMLVICSPNNPTGGLFPADKIEYILSKTDAPVVIDEAYYEFSKTTALELLKNYPNLIILRTFSKAFSLAGQRLGYALAAPEVAEEMLKVKLPFNIDQFSITAAMKLLENHSIIRHTVDEIVSERDRLSKEMAAIPGVEVYPTAANFILFRTQHDSGALAEGIFNDGILIRDLSSNPLLKNTLRVTVSTPSDNEAFLTSLKRIMGALDGRR
jgi:histidinol-phosphate aminotransferase